MRLVGAFLGVLLLNVAGVYYYLRWQANVADYSDDHEVKRLTRLIVSLLAVSSVVSFGIAVLSRYITKGLLAPGVIAVSAEVVMATGAYRYGLKRFLFELDSAPKRDQLLTPVLMAIMRIQDLGRYEWNLLQRAKEGIDGLDNSAELARIEDGWHLDAAYEEAATLLCHMALQSEAGCRFLGTLKRDFQRTHSTCFELLKTAATEKRGVAEALRLQVEDC